MSDAPKTILAWRNGRGGLSMSGGRLDDEIKYIRADLVDAILAAAVREGVEMGAKVAAVFNLGRDKEAADRQIRSIRSVITDEAAIAEAVKRIKTPDR